MFRSFSQQGQLLHPINTIITLITKVKKTGYDERILTYQSYRILYKIIFRDLTNHLRPILTNVIDKNQSEFIVRFLIKYNVSIGF